MGEERGDMFGHVSAGRRMREEGGGELENTRRVCHANAPLLAARSTLVNAVAREQKKVLAFRHDILSLRSRHYYEMLRAKCLNVVMGKMFN